MDEFEKLAEQAAEEIEKAKVEYLEHLQTFPDMHLLYENGFVMESGPMDVTLNRTANLETNESVFTVKFTKEFRLREKNDDETNEALRQVKLDGLLNFANRIGDRIARGDLPPQDENGFYMFSPGQVKL